MKATNIDILPMAAVGLILVLVMMMIAPMVMAHNDTPVTVPETHTAERKVEENTTITYTRDGLLLLDDRPCPDLAEVENRLEMELVRDPYLLVVVRADKDVRAEYRSARKKVDHLRLRGVAFTALIWIGATLLLLLLWYRFV